MKNKLDFMDEDYKKYLELKKKFERSKIDFFKWINALHTCILTTQPHPIKEDLDPKKQTTLEYWKKRAELAEKYISESPCDPDITTEQLNAYLQWQEYLKDKTNKNN